MDASANVSTNLGNAGQPLQVTLGDKIITAKFIDQSVKSKIEQMLIKRAKDNLSKEKDSFTDEEFALAYGSISDKIICGNYAFGGKVCQAFLTTLDGVAYLLHCVTGVSVEECGNLIAEHAFEINILLKNVLDGSFPFLQKQTPPS